MTKASRQATMAEQLAGMKPGSVKTLVFSTPREAQAYMKMVYRGALEAGIADEITVFNNDDMKVAVSVLRKEGLK